MDELKEVKILDQNLKVTITGQIFNNGRMLKPYPNWKKGCVVYIKNSPYSITNIVNQAFGTNLQFTNQYYDNLIQVYEEMKDETL